jgi:hypothetical protein
MSAVVILASRLEDHGGHLVRQVFHTDERWLPSTENRRAAIEYVRSQTGLLEIETAALDRLRELGRVHRAAQRGRIVTARLGEAAVRQYDGRLRAEVTQRPGLAAGVSLTINGEPSRIVESAATTLQDVRAEMPSDETIPRWQRPFEGIERRPAAIGEATPAARSRPRPLRPAPACA